MGFGPPREAPGPLAQGPILPIRYGEMGPPRALGGPIWAGPGAGAPGPGLGQPSPGPGQGLFYL